MDEVNLRRHGESDPKNPDNWHNLAVWAWAQGDLEKAKTALRRAVLLHSPYGWDYQALGVILCQRGQWTEAAELFRTARRLLRQGGTLTDNEEQSVLREQMFLLRHHPEDSAEDKRAFYQDYERLFFAPFYANHRPHHNTPEPHRRLKVGYVSSDLRGHSMMYFLLPLLRVHDRQQFELFAYAQLERDDNITEEYRRLFDHWCLTEGLNDEALAAQIRADGIDILVDLSGHLSGSRIGVFAYKPAPVSVSWWISAADTTGISAIDYLLLDRISAPVGSESLFVEQLWPLDGPACTYEPVSTIPEPGPSPCLSNGFVRFCSLTSFLRLNDRVLDVWAAILQRLPTARLVLNSHGFTLDHVCRTILRRFLLRGIGAERLEIGFDSPPWSVLQRTDITLDPFPFSSGTTLMEGLFMGHPVITWANRVPTGRLGAAHVTYAGHPEWVVNTAEEYVDRAVQVASDIEKLARIRAGLRSELRCSPMMDHAALAAKIAVAYRRMWQKWCQNGQTGEKQVQL